MKSTLKKYISPIIFIIIPLLISIPLTFACGAPQQPPQTPPPQSQGPTGNRPPVISNLTPSLWQVWPKGTSEIQVVAADPDGDKVSISWQADGGTINGSGYVVQWQAPNQYGVYKITAVASDGKGGTAQQTIEISVTANQAPQISSLTAKPSTVGIGGTSIITCIAVDADGDNIRYNWKADEGEVTGLGNTITWIAPRKMGNFNIYVTLTDGKGGETKGNVLITVSGATKTVTIDYVKEESGTIDYSGDKDNSIFRAGDDEKNIGYRAFWSFNIFSLNKTEVKEAKITFTTRNVVGDPFIKAGAQSLGGLTIWRVSYTDKLPKWDITGNKLQNASAAFYAPPSIIDVTPELIHMVNSGVFRFQIEAWFPQKSNGNNVTEYIEWTDCKLDVTYTEK